MSESSAYKHWNPEEATPEKDGKPDTSIVPYIEALRKGGVTTLQSCAGHITEDGLKHDGHIWIAPEDMSEQDAIELAEYDFVYGVCRRYAREECWEITFYGMAHETAGEETLHRAMKVIFDVLGVGLP